MFYEVQQYRIGRGWSNQWFYDEGDGVIHAETFATHAAAGAALDEFFADLAEDIAAGRCPCCSREEFRVRQVGGTATAAQPDA
jgi:hypothetical protein